MKGNILTCQDWSSKQVCYNKRYTCPIHPVGEDCDVSYEGKHFDLSRLVKQTGMLYHENKNSVSVVHLLVRYVMHPFALDARKPVFGGLQTTQVLNSLRICAV